MAEIWSDLGRKGEGPQSAQRRWGCGQVGHQMALPKGMSIEVKVHGGDGALGRRSWGGLAVKQTNSCAQGVCGCADLLGRSSLVSASTPLILSPVAPAGMWKEWARGKDLTMLRGILAPGQDRLRC